MTYKTTLENGVRVICEKMEGIRSVTIGIWVRAGSAMETAQQNGISHFIEHMMFKGTEKRTYKQIAAEIDNVGGQSNAFTSKECTCYYVKLIDEEQSLAADILCDMISNSVFDESEMKKEKGVVLEEIAMSNDQPDDVSQERVAELFFDGTPVSKTILGPADNVRAFTREDIRGYMNERYTADNICVVALGSVDAEKLVDALNEKLRVAPAGGKPAPEKDKLWVPQPHFEKVSKDVEQVHITMGMPGYDFCDPRKYAMSIVCSALGGSMSSRLFQRVREQSGMAYSVFCYASVYTLAGMTGIYAGTSTANAPKVIDMILDEIRMLKRDKMNKEEFMNVKEQLRGNFILGQESTAAKMNSIGKSVVLTGDYLTESDVLQRLKDVTLDDVNDAIDLMMDESRLTGVAVGCVDEIKEEMFKN